MPTKKSGWNWMIGLPEIVNSCNPVSGLSNSALKLSRLLNLKVKTLNFDRPLKASSSIMSNVLPLNSMTSRFEQGLKTSAPNNSKWSSPNEIFFRLTQLRKDLSLSTFSCTDANRISLNLLKRLRTVVGINSNLLPKPEASKMVTSWLPKEISRPFTRPLMCFP